MSRRTPRSGRVAGGLAGRLSPAFLLLVLVLLVVGVSGCSQVARELGGGPRSGTNPARAPSVASPVALNRDAQPVAFLSAADWDVPGGHFFTQTNGMPALASATGFAVTDAEGIPFWSEFQRLGGANLLGYPLSGRLTFQNRITQVFQRGILQWNAQERVVQPMNVLHLLDEAGKTEWLAQTHRVPARLGSDFDQGRQGNAMIGARLALLSGNPALQSKFNAAPDAVALYGLPDSRIVDQGDHLAIRLQRNVLRVWKQDVPWAKAGEATADNSGAYAVEAGLFPAAALATEQPVSAPRRANVPGLVVQPASPTPASAVAATPTTGASAASSIPAGGVLQIANTNGDGVWLRRTPKLEDKLNAWPEGALMKSLNEQAEAEGLKWQKVQAPDGGVGWIPERFLRAMR